MGGGTQRSTFDEVRPTFDVTVNGSPLDRWTFAFSAAREFLTITPRAIDLDISSYRFAADASHAFNTRTSLGFSVDLHRSMAGSFTHTILEWSAFTTAIFTAFLAFVHFTIRRDVGARRRVSPSSP